MSSGSGSWPLRATGGRRLRSIAKARSNFILNAEPDSFAQAVCTPPLVRRSARSPSVSRMPAGVPAGDLARRLGLRFDRRTGELNIPRSKG